MSKNSKNAQRIQKAREMSALHVKGEKGPAKTTPKHEKRWGYRDNPEVQKRIAEMLKATQEAKGDKTEKTSAKRILRGAGKASQPQVHVG